MNMIRGKKIYVHDYLKEDQDAKKQANKENVVQASLPNNPRIVGKRKLNSPEINKKCDSKNIVNENFDSKRPKKGKNVDSSLLQKNVITNSDKTFRKSNSLLVSSILQSSNSDTSTSTSHSTNETDRQNRAKFASFTSNIPNLDKKLSVNASKLIQSKEISTPNTATTKKIEDVKNPKKSERVNSSLLQKNVITNSDKTLRKSCSFELLFNSLRTPSSSTWTISTNSTTHSSEGVDRQNRTKFASFTSSIPNLNQKQGDDKASKLTESKEISTATTKKIEEKNREPTFEEFMNSILTPNIQSNKAPKSRHSKEASKDAETTKPIAEKNETTFEQFMNAMFSPNIPNLGRRKNDRSLKPKSSRETSTQTSFGDSIIELLTPSSSQNNAFNRTVSTQTITETQEDDDMDLTQNFSQRTSRSGSSGTKSFNNREVKRRHLPYFDSNVVSHSQENSSRFSQASKATSFSNQEAMSHHLPYSDSDVISHSQQSSSQLSQASKGKSLSNQEAMSHHLPYFDSDVVSHYSQESLSRFSQASKQTTSLSNQKAMMRHHRPYFDSVVISQSQENSSQLSQASTQQNQTNSDNEANTNEDLNILQVLGNDATLTPQNKIEFNNIAKIGTEKWFQFAQTAILKHKAKILETEVETVHNSFDDVYSNNSVKQIVKCYREGKIRIYKLENVRSDDEEIFSQNLSFEDVEESSQGERYLRIEMDETLKDKSLICTEQSPSINKNKIISMINDIFVKLYSIYENGKIPRFGTLGEYKFNHCIFVDGRLKLDPAFKRRKPVRKSYKIKINVYLTVCRMLYIMGKIYSLLETNKQLTKREVFYQVKHLVKSQSQVNTAIRKVSMFLNVGEWHLNITSNSGLVYGNLKLVWSSGKITNCNVPATMIPCNADDISEFHTNAYFILVVEKESIFQKLIQEDLPNKLTRPFILITGKGFPSFTTQLFLKKLCTMMGLPVFILVDGDVHGIRIMLQYRFGSCKNCHLSEYLAVPNARWLGVFPSEINTLGIKNLPLTMREKNNINSLLKYPWMENQQRIKEELKFLLKNNKKASIEGLIKTDNFLSGFYLPSKLKNREFV